MNELRATETPSGKEALGRVAFVMSNAIGDSLICMVIVRNLLRNGIDVTVFGKPAYELRRWFPEVTIHPLPRADESTALLARFDTLLQMQWNQPLAHFLDMHPRAYCLHAVEFGPHRGCMGERFKDFCRDTLGLSDVDIDNSVCPPADLVYRRHANRVVIHPEASTDDKRWSRSRFRRVAEVLRKRGYDPHFVIAPHERARWRELESWHIPAPHFDNLDALAGWVYESGYFIGNDSGIGHLASNLGIPSVNLYRRRAVSIRWKPAWGGVEVVLPWQWVPGSALKERLWKQTLTSSRVLTAFTRVAARQTAPVRR